MISFGAKKIAAETRCRRMAEKGKKHAMALVALRLVSEVVWVRLLSRNTGATSMEVQPTNAEETAPDSAEKSTQQPRLALAFSLSILLQVLFGLLCVASTDGGGMLQFWTFSFVGYWAGVVVIFKRRKTGNLTKGDLVFIRIGFLAILYLVAPFVAVLVWYLRGYLR